MRNRYHLLNEMPGFVTCSAFGITGVSCTARGHRCQVDKAPGMVVRFPLEANNLFQDQSWLACVGVVGALTGASWLLF